MTVTRPALKPDEQTLTRLERLGRTYERDGVKLRELALEALDKGGSVRVVAAAARVSTNTIQRWKNERTQT